MKKSFLLVLLLFALNEGAETYESNRKFSDYYEDENKGMFHQQRQQNCVCPDRGLQPRYEPLFSFGSVFLARIVNTTPRSPFIPYTKNKTILACCLLSLVLGIIIGIGVTLFFKTISSKTQSDEKESKMKEAEKETDKNKAVFDENLDSAEAFKTKNRMKKLIKRDIKESTDSINDAISQESSVSHKEKAIQESENLKVSISELTEALKQLSLPLIRMTKASQGIEDKIGWMANRKAKKDAWIHEIDKMAYGFMLMNTSLMISAYFFGRWQDWGRCEHYIFTLEIHSLLGFIWCFVEEPCKHQNANTNSLNCSRYFYVWMHVMVLDNEVRMRIKIYEKETASVVGPFVLYTFFCGHDTFIHRRASWRIWNDLILHLAHLLS